MLNVKKTLTKILTSMFGKTLYDSTKVTSGTLILADAYTNYDFLVVSYFVNADRFTRTFDCAEISSHPTDSFHGNLTLYTNASTVYSSSCIFKPTDGTHLAISNVGNNVNFIAGIVKVVGVKIPFIGGGYSLKVFSRLAERWWEYAEYKENSHENLGEHERFGRNKVVFNTNNIVQYLLWSSTERCNPCRVYSNSTNKSINQSRIMRILRRWIRWEHGANWCSKILTKRNSNEFVWNIRSSVCTLRSNRLTISERGWACA